MDVLPPQLHSHQVSDESLLSYLEPALLDPRIDVIVQKVIVLFTVKSCFDFCKEAVNIRKDSPLLLRF